MGPANCAVIGCSNSTYKLINWQKSSCNELGHEGSLKKNCACQPPFRLYLFPSEKRNLEKRKLWTSLLRRETVKKSAWSPCASDRVCSEHFVDGIPTVENPNPTLKLGYSIVEKSKRRELFKHDLKKIKADISTTGTSSLPPSPPMSPNVIPICVKPSASDNHTCCSISNEKNNCDQCSLKDALISSNQLKINKLSLQLRQMKVAYKKATSKTKPFTITDIKTDEKMNFYTGITSIAIFEAVYKMLLPLIPSITFWRGTKKVVSQVVRPKKKRMTTSIRKLTPKNELLLTLMRLRLGLLNEDLADRFGISPATCSETFKTWISFLSMTIGNFVQWLPKESVQENMPKSFKKAGYGKVRVIIDCSEIFIERPKSLEIQAVTWSDYKSHNTIKFLIGISPTGYITFLSDCYGGRASDRFICKDSCFYDLLDTYDEVMADRGFQIMEELLLNFCTLSVPPGARLKSQMTSAEVKKAINRIKTFRIFKSVLPITMLHHCDDIIRTCAALCNLKPLLYKESKTS